jgi:DNA-directed RNA polymerase specialized sigma24 family protein
MSAALQLPAVWAASLSEAAREIERKESKSKGRGRQGAWAEDTEPAANLAFYRKHTENLLRRYLYASTQVGRAPSILSAPVGRGWVSSRPVRSFEDAVIFVLDVEGCLNRLSAFDRQLLSRLVLQEYTQQETAAMLGMCVRTVSSKLGRALDRLTEQLLAADLLILPD